MMRTIARRYRILLAAVPLLLVAACSNPPSLTAPADVSVHAGPELVQLYWTQRGAEPGDAMVEYRDADVADAAWQEARPSSGRVGEFLIPYPDAERLQFRVGVARDDLWLWSEPTAAITRPDGVTLQVGSLNRGYGETAGTVFLVVLDLPEDVTGPLELTVTGPDGWAPEAPGAIGVDPSQLAEGYLIQHFYGLDIMNGTYRISLTDYGEGLWEHEVTLADPDFRLEVPTRLTADVDTAAGTVQASWIPPISGAHTNVSLHTGDILLEGYPHTLGSSYGFTGITFPSGTVQLEVTSTNWLPGAEPLLLPVPFGASTAQLDFLVPR